MICGIMCMPPLSLGRFLFEEKGITRRSDMRARNEVFLTHRSGENSSRRFGTDKREVSGNQMNQSHLENPVEQGVDTPCNA